MQLVLDKVLSNLEWPHSQGAMQDKFFSASCTICVAEGIGSDNTLQISSRDFSVSNSMQRSVSQERKNKFKYSKTASHKQLHDVFVAV